MTPRSCEEALPREIAELDWKLDLEENANHTVWTQAPQLRERSSFLARCALPDRITSSVGIKPGSAERGGRRPDPTTLDMI